jgi:iron(III) transport system substrate-binding protein
MTHLSASRGRILVPFMSVLLVGFLGCAGPDPSKRVVLYCAQDREFAVDILQEFTRQTGLEVIPRFDSEANKAVGLYEDLVQEASRPRCDVHWNNEILATIRLQRQGIYEPYPSPSGDAFPEAFRAKDRTWHAFAARARVLLINTDLVKPEDRPARMWDLADKKWAKRLTMAKPLFGTTATQAACLFQAWGPDKAQSYYQQLKANGIQLVAGNKQVAVGVGKGQFAVGFTDTDDAMAELDAKNPVVMVFPDADATAEDLGTLFIPNTVAVVKGGPNPAGARRLVDYLLSPEVEAKLAQGGSRQIPLNPKVHVELPREMAPALAARKLPVDFGRAADLWQQSQAFLIKEFGLR